LAHVVFDGEIQQHPALRSLLWQWGVTVGPLPGSGRVGVLATVEDCDAVLSVGNKSHASDIDFSAMPDGAEAEGAAAAAAPLLVVGPLTESGAQFGHELVSIPDFGPGGSRLKAALHSCVEKSRLLRGEAGARHDLNQFRDFVGHELRSPLTAVKTALTALEDSENPDPGAARMLSIALRNLRRLTETVEWSQELTSLAETTPVADLAPVPAAAVARVIPDHLDVHLGQNCESGEILTDLGLLGVLVRQMERVFAYGCPEKRPTFRLEFDPDGGDCRLSAYVTESGNEAASNRVSRSGGREPSRDKATWNRAEFENLSRMLISPQLLQVLGVKTRIPSSQRGTLELSIGLPLWTAATPDPVEPLYQV
jgi:hypothetical protein